MSSPPWISLRKTRKERINEVRKCTLLASATLQPRVDKPPRGCLSVSTLRESLERSSLKRNRKSNARVSFDRIKIRKYSRTVGDNPAVSSGPALAIDWFYDPRAKIITVDEYEEIRGPRRTPEELKLDPKVRRHMLEYTWKIPLSQLVRAEEDARWIQNNRKLSYSYRGLDPPKLIISSVWRRGQRWWTGRTKKEEQEWLWIYAHHYYVHKHQNERCCCCFCRDDKNETLIEFEDDNEDTTHDFK